VIGKDDLCSIGFIDSFVSTTKSEKLKLVKCVWAGLKDSVRFLEFWAITILCVCSNVKLSFFPSHTGGLVGMED
jgi:hypothetical protein